MQSQKEKINLIACLMDVNDQLLSELAPSTRQGMKMLCGRAMKHTKQFIKECDTIFSPDEADNFGLASDEIRELLDNYIKSKESES